MQPCTPDIQQFCVHKWTKWLNGFIWPVAVALKSIMKIALKSNMKTVITVHYNNDFTVLLETTSDLWYAFGKIDIMWQIVILNLFNFIAYWWIAEYQSLLLKTSINCYKYGSWKFLGRIFIIWFAVHCKMILKYRGHHGCAIVTFYQYYKHKLNVLWYFIEISLMYISCFVFFVVHHTCLLFIEKCEIVMFYFC